MSTATKRKRARPAKLLSAYRAKRNLRASGEPTGVRAGPAVFPRFVIQKHAARRLHYDFRLEMEGVLRSWAVPKGLPLRTGRKVLAIEVEDHPLAYGKFEGRIPAGHYGAGTVQLWDSGFYATVGPAPAAAYRAGRMHLALAGRKCRGEWSLVKMHGRGEKNWLLFKNRSTQRQPKPKPANRVARARSVLTGRTMAEIAADQPAREAGEETGEAAGAPLHRRFVEPMKALAVTAIPGGRAWRLEIKFDGYRVLAAIEGRKVTLWSRNRRELNDDFPEIAADLRDRHRGSLLIDGEIVALDPAGRSRFQLLQQRDTGPARGTLRYYVFDLLEADGRSLLGEPIETRRAELERLLAVGRGMVRLSPVFQVSPEELLVEVRRKGLEGIVAKAPGSRYEAGRRSGSWLKCRVANEQEFVIGGFTPPQGSRQHFGALLLGYHERKQLRFAGKVGTGFDAARLGELQRLLAKRVRKESSFTPVPPLKGARWVRPELVCQIRFAEWTDDGRLRHPVYLGLRKDKPASAVVREAPAAT